MHINFIENKPNVAGKGPNWLFDLDYLTDSMNYHSVSSENQANIHAGQQESNQNEGTKDKIVAGDSEKEDESAQDCFEVPFWHSKFRQEKEANGVKLKALRTDFDKKTENLSLGWADSGRSARLAALNRSILMKGKVAFSYGKMDEEVYVSHHQCFQDLSSPQKVYKVVFKRCMDTQAPRAWSVHVLESPHLTWNPTQIVIMLEQILTGNPNKRMSISWQELITWQLQNAKTIVALLHSRADMWVSILLLEAFEDMRFVRPSKEYFQAKFVPLKRRLENNTDRPKLSTDDFKVSTDEQMESTDDQVDASEEIFKGSEDQGEGTEEKVESTMSKIEGTEEQSKEEIATLSFSTSHPTTLILTDDDIRMLDEEKEETMRILDRRYISHDWKTVCLGTKPQPDQAKTLENINLNVVTRSNGQQRYFSILTTVLSIFDREDLNVVYQLVMDKYQDEMPEGFERVLWGDLMVLFNPVITR
ncbi:hypothetical protein Tco_0577663 [Tanacetum coccineum]